MQADTAYTRQHHWCKWGRVLLFGVVLGLIELLLILGWAWLQHWQYAGTLFVVLSLFFYVFLPAVEGFLAADPRETVAFAAVCGLLVGSIGLLILALAVVCALLFIPPTVQSSCPQGESCPMDQGAGLVFLIVFFLFEGLAAGIGGLFGGLLGDALGLLYAPWSRPRDTSPAGDALSSGAPQP